MEAPIRNAAMQLMSAIVDGVGALDRNSASVQGDALKAASRVAKENGDSETLLAVAGITLDFGFLIALFSRCPFSCKPVCFYPSAISLMLQLNSNELFFLALSKFWRRA